MWNFAERAVTVGVIAAVVLTAIGALFVWWIGDSYKH